jgi:hypothetical protein
MRFMKLADSDAPGIRRRAKPAFVVSALMALVSAFALAKLMGLFGVTAIEGALEIAFWGWLGLIAATEVTTVLYEDRDRHLYLLHIAYEYISLVIMASIIVLWR